MPHPSNVDKHHKPAALPDSITSVLKHESLMVIETSMTHLEYNDKCIVTNVKCLDNVKFLVTTKNIILHRKYIRYINQTNIIMFTTLSLVT